MGPPGGTFPQEARAGLPGQGQIGAEGVGKHLTAPLAAQAVARREPRQVDPLTEHQSGLQPPVEEQRHPGAIPEAPLEGAFRDAAGADGGGVDEMLPEGDLAVPHRHIASSGFTGRAIRCWARSCHELVPPAVTMLPRGSAYTGLGAGSH